jgi:uncharacterized membrane protein YbhN (UPF0104 family)
MKNKYLARLKNTAQVIVNSGFVKFLKRYKKTLAILVIMAFFAFIAFYIYGHPEILKNILKIGPVNTVLVLLLYCGVLLTNVGIVFATIKLCRKNLSIKNSIFLTIYSSIVNFFGPLQSGPAVRAVYLKTKVGLRIRDYTFTMFFYYLSYAAINVSLLFITKIPLITFLGIAAAIALISIGTKRLGFGSLKKYVFYIFAATIAQIILTVFIYSIELNAINPMAHYDLLHIITYTATANLALFVSLTPGAIGIREAFLVLAQSLHHIPLVSIVATGIVDRAIYVVFLILMLIASSTLHLKNIIVRK